MSDRTPFPATRPVDGPVTDGARPAPAVLPVVRGPGERTIGVLVFDPDGARWQRTTDVEGLVCLGVVAVAAVALPVGILAALRRPTARIDRLSMGPGGWVSFRGFGVPKRRRQHRPWWAVLLGIRRAT